MAGYSRFYVFGGQGGYMGADGVNPVEFLILVGDAHRQWLEPRYFDRAIKPLGKLKSIIPAGPDHPDGLLDACIAFYPRLFQSCVLLAGIEPQLGELKQLDFDAAPQNIPAAWAQLREQARPLFAKLNIWRADLVPYGANADQDTRHVK